MKKIERKLRKEKRIRKKIQGTDDMPRLCVFRSNRFVYAQIINDSKHMTLFGISERHIENHEKTSGIENARKLGKMIAQKASEKKIKKVVFDKGSYAYHGKIKAIAEGAREGGLQF